MRAFTLIEVLLVVALLGIASVYSAGAMLSANNASARMQSVNSLLDADARCRIIAQQTPGGASLQINKDRQGFTLLDGAAEQIVLHELPSGITAHLMSAHDQEPLDALRYDASGRTDNYVIYLRQGDRTLAYAVNGETGWSRPAEAGP